MDADAEWMGVVAGGYVHGLADYEYLLWMIPGAEEVEPMDVISWSFPR